jgi:hypothetical protein
MKNLHNDTARCNGVGNDKDGWREGCERCLRRIAPRLKYCLMMEPPPIVVFECDYLIEEKGNKK